MEESLNGFLQAALFNPEQLKLKLDRTNFHVRGDFAVSLAAGRVNDEMWPVFWAINQLCNKLAHNLDSEEIDKMMAYLREVYIKALQPNPAEYATKLGDTELAEQACGVCAGFLAQLVSEARERRSIINLH
jgi:hypothetical protein